MSEATGSTTTRRLALEEMHVAQGAVIREYNGWRLPAAYGDLMAEYSAVRNHGSGLIDLSARGRLHVSGSEAIQFLNGLITNDVKALEAGTWMAAAFPNVQGRLIAAVRVIHEEDGFLIDTEASTYEKVLQTLNRFTLAGDFQVKDLTDATALFSIQGKSAEDMLRAVLDESFSALGQNETKRVQWQGTDILLLRATHTAEDGFDVVVDSEKASALWEKLRDTGAQPVGREAFEILRIEAGEPLYGIDMDETRIVTEASLDHAVSYTKGCYIGQEIIARIHWRGHVAKKLTGIIFDAPKDVSRDTKIRSIEGRDIGTLTSVVYSPSLGQTIALGYVKYDYLAPETAVKIVTDGEEFPGRITELPFVRGSWYQRPNGPS
ncbi:MAG TPA: aminomethyltransferase family protein [Pyrinomonadaceae bacterium]|nr:aminomethyltransferase family protein [Pyrinomonadaceae bacterium]